MPIKIPNDLPAAETLQKEHVFVMHENMAFHQDIRPLKIAIMNLMPTKIVTETQLLRLPATHRSKNTSLSHLNAFYVTPDAIKNEKFDGLIITGAPVEQLPFQEVGYWDELCRLMEWSRMNVTTTLHICWGAQAGLFYHY